MKTKQENQDFTSKKAYWGGGGVAGVFSFRTSFQNFNHTTKKKGKKWICPEGGGGRKSEGDRCVAIANVVQALHQPSPCRLGSVTPHLKSFA